MSARMSSKWSHPRDSRSPVRNRARDSRSPGRNRARGRGSPYRGERSRRRESGSPLRSKRRRWDSPSRDHRFALDSPPRSQRKYRFDSPPRSYRNELDSPTRSRRKDRWDSPPRPGRSDLNSPSRSLRKDFDLSPRSRRDGVDDGFRVSHAQYLRNEGNNRIPAAWHGQGPAGLVFLCSTSTKRECFHYGVFGLPLAQREIVERVVPGTKLFLFNVETKELFGIFEAASPGGLNLVPEAFREFQGSYASQVRVRLYRECLPLADNIVKDVLKENLSERGKFDCELSADQVLKLIQLFSASGLQPQNAAPGMGSHWDNADVLSSRNTLPNAQLHVDKGDASFFVGSKLLGESAYPGQAEGAGQGTIEEVDQLALKYLQNNPGFLGNRMDSLDGFLHGTSGYTRDNSHSSVHGLSIPQMNHVPREDVGNYSGIGVQPLPGSVSGVPPRMLNSFNHESNMQHYLREAAGISNRVGPPGSGGSLAPLVNGALLPMGMGATSTAERQAQATSEGNMAIKGAGHSFRGALRNDKGMGLLPLPGATLNMPHQAAPPLLVPPMALPGSSVRAWPLQAGNSIPPRAIVNPQVAATSIRPPVNIIRPQMVRNKMKPSAATGEKSNQLSTAESASKNS